MVQRKTVAVDHDHGERVIDLPVIDGRFATEADAEASGAEQARRWIAHNVSPAA